MRRGLEQLLKEFVNREAELGRFKEMLDTEDISIFVVWGGGGVGKSILQARLIHEVALRELRKVEIVWSETRNPDYLAIMRKIRDDLGVKHFAAFTDLVNYFTKPQHKLTVDVTSGAGISVAEGATVEKSSVKTMAGVIIEDLYLTVPRADMQVSQSERMAQLTDCFIPCLRRSVAGDTVVIFFDAVEKMSEETEAWIWNELLPAGRDGRLGRVKFVLCGRKEPTLDRSWGDAVQVSHLGPLAHRHIVDYLANRGVDPAGREQLATMLLAVTAGNLLELATHVDTYLKLEARQNRAHV